MWELQAREEDDYEPGQEGLAVRRRKRGMALASISGSFDEEGQEPGLLQVPLTAAV